MNREKVLKIAKRSLALSMVGAATLLPLSPVDPWVTIAKAADTRTVPQPELNGKTIRSIKVQVRPVFDDEGQGLFYNAVNKLKIETREVVVRRELFFAEGEEYNDFKVRESERELRSLRFLRNVSIRGVPDGDVVDIIVTVQDTWTLVPQVSFSSGGGTSDRSIGIAESNILGYGKRIEFLNREKDGRSIIETVWDDPRVFGSRNRFLIGYFDRDDGERALLSMGRPFRTLITPSAWSVEAETADVVGRLWQYGDERFIYRRNATDLRARYTIAKGVASSLITRYSLGGGVLHEEFSLADSRDYEILDIDPSSVSQDPALLAHDRRYVGPSFGYQSIQPDYISLAYIDRFQRVEDYNLGHETSVDIFVAPSILGSDGSQLMLNANRSTGWRFSPYSFARIEGGVGGRINRSGIENSLIRGEAKYYNVLGSLFWHDLFLGKHTLAANLYLDYGIELDRDREFLVGGEEGLRGYEARAFSGDKRIGLNLENRVHFVDDLFRLVSLGAAAFVDVGGATRESFGTLLQDRIYSNVGVGLRVGFPRSSGGAILRFDVAVPLRDGPDGTGAFEPQFVVSAGQLFSSRLRSESYGVEKANVDVGFQGD